MSNTEDVIADSKNDAITTNKNKSVPKCKKYENERKDVANRLLNILGITSENTIFYVEDIVNDDNKKKQILDLVDDVKKYFKYYQWTYFNGKNVQEPYISLIKSILKDTNIKLSIIYLKDDKNRSIKKRGFHVIAT